MEVSFDPARLRTRGARPTPPAHPRQPFLAHQPRHAFAAHRVPPSDLFGMNPRRPVEPAPAGGSGGPSRTLMNRPDLAPQLPIASRMARTPAASPRIVPAGGDTQHPAHRGCPVGGSVHSHEIEDLPGTVPVSRANQAAALFRIRLPSADNKTAMRERVPRGVRPVRTNSTIWRRYSGAYGACLSAIGTPPLHNEGSTKSGQLQSGTRPCP